MRCKIGAQFMRRQQGAAVSVYLCVCVSVRWKARVQMRENARVCVCVGEHGCQLAASAVEGGVERGKERANFSQATRVPSAIYKYTICLCKTYHSRQTCRV